MDNFDATPPNANHKTTRRFVGYYWSAALVSRSLLLLIIIGALTGWYIVMNYTGGSLIIGGAIGAFIGGLIARVSIHYIDKSMLKNSLAAEKSIRNDREAEKLKAIAKAKASGKFDRFNNDEEQSVAKATNGENNV